MLIEVAEPTETPISGLSVAQIRSRLDFNRRLRAMLEAEDLELLRRLESGATDSPEIGLVFPEREIMKHGGLSSREAASAMARARTVDVVPALGEVLAAGSTTAGHVDAMARGLKIVGDDRELFLQHSSHLVEASTRLPVGDFAALVRDTARAVVSDGGLATFERQRRSTYLKTWLDSEGMTQVRGSFDPVSGAAICGVISREVERMFHAGDTDSPVMPWIEPNENRAARALVNVLCRPETGSTMSSGPRAEVIVHIDLARLSGAATTGVSSTHLGSDIPVETVRRLACGADIIPVVLDGASVPIDVGRAKRLATAHQRRALEAVHHTCAVPDCGRPYHQCQIHHIRYWEDGGPSDLDNMVPLCSRHHHDVHEGGWNLTLDLGTRRVSFTPPG